MLYFAVHFYSFIICYNNLIPDDAFREVTCNLLLPMCYDLVLPFLKKTRLGRNVESFVKMQ